MLESFHCPVCGERRWQALGRRVYRRDHAPSSPYVEQRLRVLFDIWSRADEVTLTSVLCEACGFICYSPRPSEADLDAKYRFLSKNGVAGYVDPSVQEARARRLFATLRPWVRRLPKGAKVLDFGGSDGRLLAPLAAAGFQCSLVDHNSSPVAGVHWIGDTLDALDEDTRFGVIVCSHVLEHLAEPRQVLSRLAGRLHDNGVMYVEVPHCCRSRSLMSLGSDWLMVIM